MVPLSPSPGPYQNRFRRMGNLGGRRTSLRDDQHLRMASRAGDGVFSQRHPPQRPPRRNSQLGADGEHPRPDHDRRNRLGKADDVLPAPGIPRERTERERKGRGRIPRNGHGRRFAGRLRDHRPGARKAQPVRRQSQPEGPEDAHRLRKLQGGQAHTDHRAVGRVAR